MASPSSARALDEALAARLAGEPDVVVAYLFGSHARGTASALSDVDVAVLLGEGWAPDRHLELIDAVAEVVGSERADVVVLNDAPVALAYRVLRDGRPLVVNDERARVRHWVATVDRYLDMAPLRHTLEEGATPSPGGGPLWSTVSRCGAGSVRSTVGSASWRRSATVGVTRSSATSASRPRWSATSNFGPAIEGELGRRDGGS